MSQDATLWLWAFLADPHVLRLLLEKDAPYTLRYAAERLPSGPLAPAIGKNDALRALEAAGVFNAPSHTQAWSKALAVLHDPKHLGLALKSAQTHGLPELLPEGDPRPNSVVGLVEAHAHLRGSMPFVAMWAGWLWDERLRASVRGPDYQIRADERSWTWAELMERTAAHCSCRCAPSADLSQWELAGATWLRALVERCRPERARPYAVRTLAIALVLRRALHMQPHTASPGLCSFVEYFDRSSRAQKPSEPNKDLLRWQTRLILRRFADEGVRVLELRPTFESTPSALRQRLRQMLLAYLDHLHDPEPHLQLGLVISLFRQEKKREGLPPEARPAVWLNQLDGLLALLDEVPLYRWLVVGIDAAGQERGCPLALLRPVTDRLKQWHAGHGVAVQRPGLSVSSAWFREFRDRSTDSEGALETLLKQAEGLRWPGWPRLGLTLHVGEDFADPLTGLRLMHEALTTLDMRCGDRIGHGLAAAMDSPLLEEWLERREGRGAGVLKEDGLVWIHKTRGEHIADLAWAAAHLEGCARQWVMAELGTTLGRAWAGRGQSEQLATALLPVAPGQVRLPGLLYDTIPGEDSMEWVPAHKTYRAAFETLRVLVLREVVCRDVVIETCPTSNKVVVDLATPPARTFLRERRKSGLKFLIATDDPGIFGVWPQDELARMYNALDGDTTLTAELDEVLHDSPSHLFMRPAAH